MKVREEFRKALVGALEEDVPYGAQVKEESLVLSLFHEDDHVFLVPYGGGNPEFKEHVTVLSRDVGDDDVRILDLMPDVCVDHAGTSNVVRTNTFERAVQIGADAVTRIAHDPGEVVIDFLWGKGADEKTT